MPVFNDEQKSVLEYKEGILSVPSVPGSGKTFVLTHLALQLKKKTPEDKRILLLTYMNSAVENFYTRLKELDPKVEGIEVKTIHKFCLDIIKENSLFLNLSENFMLLDNQSSAKITEDIFKNWFSKNREALKFLYSDYNKENEEDLYLSLKYCFLNAVSRCKNFGISLDKLKSLEEKSFFIEWIIEFWGQYEIELKKLNYIDYDDILISSYNLLNEDDGLLKKYSNLFSFILEDESQDSNFLQNKIVQLLAENNLIKVGDANQNITGSFSNSSPYIFRKFCKNSQINIELKSSYRSSQNITNFANLFIKFTKFHHPVKDARKALNPPYINSYNQLQGGIKNFITKNLNEEFILATEKIKSFRLKFPDKNIGILVPRNKHLNIMANLLKKENLDFEILSDFSQANLQLYEKLANIISFIHNPHNKNHIIKLLEQNFYKKELVLEIRKLVYEISNEELFSRNDLEFHEFMNKLKKLLMYSLNTKEKTLLYIAQNFDFDEDEKSLIESIALSLKTVFRLNPKWSYKDLINELKRVENNKFNYFNWGVSNKKIKNKPITITTYHKSKGKEWDMVYLLALNEEFFPMFLHKEQQGEKSYLKEEYKIIEAKVYYEIEKILKSDLNRDPILYYKVKKIEESMRVIYVGITRAKEFLLISSNFENDGVFYYKLFRKIIKKIKKDS